MFVNSSGDSYRQRLFTTNATKSIVFIDPAVEDYQTLANGVLAGAEAIVLDPSKDGIEQISEVLSGRENISSLHIVSNGQSGKLYLGKAEVSSNTLDRYSEELQRWAKSLTPNADIFLYGCNVGAGEEGQQFIQDLSGLTGADIAASSDLTGSATRGGDWDLEVRTRGIKSASAFQPQVLQSYQGLLDVGDGLRGEYFNNKNFTNLKLTRTDPTINFNWGKGSPAASIGKDSFSVRWTGQVLADYTENYTFFTTPDDTAKLWINGQQIINATRKGQEASGTIRLNAGQRYDVRLEYVENIADARVDLSWSSPSQSKQIIPQSRLFSTISQGPGTISLATSTPPFVSEEAGKVALTVVRTGGSSGTVTVNYSVDDQTALAGSDYVDIPNGSLTFLDGETSKTIEINLIDDDVFESDETFTVGLLGTNGIGQVGTPRTATVTIVDDDSPSTVTFSQPTYSVAENGGNASITVERAGNLSKPATVNYATSNGTAIAPSDYTATSGTLSFAAGEITKTISIPIINDALIESSETLNIALSNPGRRTRIGSPSTATLTIVDNDPSFTRQTVVSGLNQPTVVDWTPDGSNMFIAQKDGVVRVFRNGTLQSTPFINISNQVNNVRDRGLLGMAIHPNFATNPYVYLLFTYDPPEASNNINPGTNLDDPDGAGNRPSRLIRVTATTDPVTGNITAVPGSEVVLLGKNSTWEYTSRPDGNSTNDSSIPPSGINNGTTIVAPQTLIERDANNNLTNNIRDYLATDSESHTIGAVHFGSDGALYVSNGDGTSYNFADPRTVRVQDLNNLSGKILRIDPNTGAGLSDNPFFNGADGADNNRDKVFDYGVRNSFRFTFDPVTGLPVIGDVGWSQWEEINTGRGVNFGWPYYEGGNGVSLQQSTGYANLPEAQAFYASGQSVTAPIYARTHANGAIAIIMGDFYDNNRLIFGDVGEGNIYEATLDQNRNISGVRVFDSGLPYVVDMEKGPDGNMYGVNLGNGTIFRWVPA